MPKKRTTRGLKKGKGMFGNKMMIAALVGIIVIGGGLAAFYLMPGRDAVTWDNATEVMRDRGVPSLPDTPSGTTATTEINETEMLLMINPVDMRVYGIDGDGVRHEVTDTTSVQSAYLGDVEIFDVEFDIAWNLVQYFTYYPDTFSVIRDIQIYISIVDSAVFDTYGNSYVNNTPVLFSFNTTAEATSLTGYVTFSMVADLYGLIDGSIDTIDNTVFENARAAGLMNQVLEEDNVTITDVTGMLTFEYGILGFYMVDGLGSDANRALKRLTVTTEPVAPEAEGVPPASAFAVYSIGGYQVSDTVLIIGMGVFAMILVFVYLSRRR